jgi:lambda family phage minor tail protein L
MTIEADIAALSPSALVELFELDLTPLGGELVRFHAGTNQIGGDVTWQGNIYSAFPVQATGFAITGTGTIPRPKMTVANVTGLISAFVLSFNDLLGAKITRKRTLVKYLDAVNFPGGTNPTADPDSHLADDVYSIDRKSAENKNAVEFELAAAFDVQGVQLPRRQIIRNLCSWAYRGPECGFTGAPIWDANDTFISSASSAEGNAVIAAYNALQARKTELMNAEAALVTASSNMESACLYGLLSSSYSATVAAEYYVFIAGQNTSYNVALYNGATVSLGSVYRRGDFVATGGVGYRQTVTGSFYKIEVWGIPAGCAAATTAYNTALTTRDNAITARATASDTLDAAILALPSDDPLYTQDKCPKRINSCKLRFGQDLTGQSVPISFGGFPAAGLVR